MSNRMRRALNVFLKREAKLRRASFGNKLAGLPPAVIAAHVIAQYAESDREINFTSLPLLDHVHDLKVALACHTGFISHTGRALLIARELRRLGAEVIIIGEWQNPETKRQNYSGLFDKEGFEHVHAPGIDRDKVMGFARNRVSWGFYDVTDLEQHALTLHTILQSLSADIVVSDFCPPIAISAEALGKPLVSIQNHLWTSFSQLNHSIPEAQIFAKLLRPLGLLHVSQRLSEQFGLARKFHSWQQHRWAVPYNRVRSKPPFSLSARPTYYDHMQGELVLMPDFLGLARYSLIPEHQIDNESGKAAIPIGPLIWEPEWRSSTNNLSEDLTSDEPFVYVSMGSTGTKELFTLILDSLERLDLRAIVTRGKHLAGWERWNRLSNRVRVVEFWPGNEILQSPGCRAMINHGGSGSTYQAITYGCPQLMIPTHADQQWNAELIEREGLGTVAYLYALRTRPLLLDDKLKSVVLD